MRVDRNNLDICCSCLFDCNNLYICLFGLKNWYYKYSFVWRRLLIIGNKLVLGGIVMWCWVVGGVVLWWVG